MGKIEITKLAVRLVVGAGAGTIVKGIVMRNVYPENIVQKVTIFAGALVLGAMAADASTDYTDAKIDGVVAWWRKNSK
jgi:hypothetical protein